MGNCCLGVFVFSGPRSLVYIFLFPLPNLYLPAPVLSLFLPALVLNLCLPVLCFTAKDCYSYSVYLYKLSVYSYVLAS